MTPTPPSTWRERRDKKKSPWNLVQFALWVPLLLGCAGAFGRAAWSLHVWLHPEHAGRFSEFWPEGISVHAMVPRALLMVPVVFPAIVVSLFLSNLILWCIPPARLAMEAEAAGDHKMTFAGANRGLLLWGGLVSAVAVALSVSGAIALWDLK